MKIDKGTLPAIQAGEDDFVKFYTAFASEKMADACLIPVLNKQRIIAAHGAWNADLKRIKQSEQHLSEGLDHFKLAGHLTYWTRRTSPIIDADEPNFDTSEVDGEIFEQSELLLREKMFGFWNEYIAFEMGFQFCKFYEIGQPGPRRNADFSPSIDYYDTMCQFLKYKNVSPHALFLIFKGLFIA